MSDPLDEALDLINHATEQGMPLRLMGGLAVRFLCPQFEPRSRKDQDIDLVSRRQAKRGLVDLLLERGYVPDKHFNALNGHKQLYFDSPHSERAVDIVLDVLDMCHQLPLGDRLGQHPITIDPTDLLLSKLQIVELDRKDVQDIVYLLAALPITDGVPGSISRKRVEEVVARDWGWWKTITTNLEQIEKLLQSGHATPPPGPNPPAEQASVLREISEQAPKQLRWQARAVLGTRLRWYNLPEIEQH